MKFEPENLLNYVYFYKNKDEMIKLAKFFLLFGYETYIPISGMDFDFYYYFYEEKYGKFLRSRASYSGKIMIKYDDVKDIVEKYEKIERPDIDPYGEDDWGFAKKENKTYIMKYHKMNEELKRKLSVGKLKYHRDDEERERLEKRPIDLFTEDEMKMLRKDDFEIDNNEKEAKCVEKYFTFAIKKIIDVDDIVTYILTAKDNRSQETYERRIKVTKREQHKETLDFMLDKCAYILHNMKEKAMKDLDPYGEEKWEEDEKDRAIARRVGMDPPNPLKHMPPIPVIDEQLPDAGGVVGDHYGDEDIDEEDYAEPTSKEEKEIEGTCPVCNGERTEFYDCDDCGGSGDDEYGNQCSSCGGEGSYEDVCGECGGTGMVKKIVKKKPTKEPHDPVWDFLKKHKPIKKIDLVPKKEKVIKNPFVNTYGDDYNWWSEGGKSTKPKFPEYQLSKGEKVKYTCKESKHDGKVGTFNGIREKEGKIQWSFKLDNGENNIILFVEPGTLHPTDEPITKSVKPKATKKFEGPIDSDEFFNPYEPTTKIIKPKSTSKPKKQIECYHCKGKGNYAGGPNSGRGICLFCNGTGKIWVNADYKGPSKTQSKKTTGFSDGLFD